MAGDGTRFGGTFKPFLYATEKKFITLAKEPFDILKDYFKVQFIFIYRKDQEENYSVSKNLRELFPNDVIQTCILPSKTIGPIDTLQQAIKILDISGYAFTCDCDHSVNIEPILEILRRGHYPKLLVPTWKITEEDTINWGTIKISDNGEHISVQEKVMMPFGRGYKILGIIGCCFWNDISLIIDLPSTANISEIVSSLHASVEYVELVKGEFFGTSDKLIEFRRIRARQQTFFIDIDGTLLELKNGIHYTTEEVSVLPNTIEKLEKWRREGHTIVLTTGRDTARRNDLIRLLADLRVPYDELVTGLPSGCRNVINDKKPYNPIQSMAMAYQIERNEGIAHITTEEPAIIISALNGASGAQVYLIGKGVSKSVRKYIRKRREDGQHVTILKRQCDDLRRFAYYSPGFVPKIVDEYESSNEYYYDMEYMMDYVQLSKLDEHTIRRVLPTILERLQKDVYSYKKSVDGMSWLQGYLNEKVLARLPIIDSFGKEFNILLYSPTLMINDIEIKGVAVTLSEINMKDLVPGYTSPIHGDLTLENILYNLSTGESKLIDPAGSRYMDAYELDIGKIMQSIISKYETWGEYVNLIRIDGTSIYVPEGLLDLHKEFVTDILISITDNPDKLFRSGLFYLATHLIRLIPFMIHKSKNKSLFALSLSAYYLYYLNE
jgi:hypothetical protein